MSTNIYHYSSNTNEYIGQSLAVNDPIDGTPLIPAFATDKPLPILSANQVAVFDTVSNSWSAVDDYRGYIGFDATGVEQKITKLGIAPDPTWTTTKPFILSEAQKLKRDEIRTAFQAAAALPVTDVTGNTWNGGYDSAIKIDAAKRMAQLNSSANVTLYDINNVAHVLTIADAASLILAIGADYQTKFAAKQNFMLQVDAAASQADLDAIVVIF